MARWSTPVCANSLASSSENGPTRRVPMCLAGSVKLDGTAIDPAAGYRVAMNSFLAGGGDGFAELGKGTNVLVGGDDLAAFVARPDGQLLRHGAVSGALGGPCHGRSESSPGAGHRHRRRS